MKRIISMIVVLLLFCGTAVSVFAHEIPDLQRIGSITFSMKYNGQMLKNGALSMYRVGDIVEENGNYYFKLIPELADTGISLEDLTNISLAVALTQAAMEAKLTGLHAEVINGQVTFTQIPNGLYVVVQTDEDACDDFLPINPFLISMPQYTADGYVYNINCAPKVALVPKETEPSLPDSPEPPQTGDRPLPILLMLVSGTAIFILGWYPGYKRRRSGNEA